VADEYQSLYRKYRPQGPTEVLGQEHVVRALMGAVREGRLAHAFLFCGPRGTGKTSTARILAKMVNCENGPTAEPCGTCEQCVRIREGQHLDVVEIDAASHGGVEDARDLREKAPTAPVQGREKVYIIDEAQRLSTAAFDALLKVFEEPPVGVRFVLATTEPHKMPATIVGRTQRFDFRRGEMSVVAEHLQRIAKDEGITLTESAANAIARQSEGSFRDALSLLDQASVLGGTAIDDDVIASLIGSGRSDVQYALGDAVAVGDAKGVFELVNQLVQEGIDLRHITNEVIAHFRNLLLVKTAPGQPDLLDVTGDEFERLSTQAGKFQGPELARVISLLLAAQTDMRWTTSPRLSLELALIRSTIPEADERPEALVARLERLERIAGVGGGAVAPGSGSAADVGGQQPPAASNEPSATTPPPTVSAASAPGDGPPKRQPASRPTSAPKAAEGAVATPSGAAASAEPAREPKAPAAPGEAAPQVKAAASSGPVLGAGTSAVDVGMLRREWGTVISHLRGQGKAVLPAFLESATPAAFDGSSLELVFPPEAKLGPRKIEEREDELRQALQELFGVSPRITCVIREAVAGIVEIEEDDTPLSEEEALARLTAELGAPAKGEGGS
jgi:DNA polymerase-3 subunit gamma/tau